MCGKSVVTTPNQPGSVETAAASSSGLGGAVAGDEGCLGEAAVAGGNSPAAVCATATYRNMSVCKDACVVYITSVCKDVSVV